MPTNYVPTFDFEHNNDLVLMLMMQMDLAAQIEHRLDGMTDEQQRQAFSDAAEGMCLVSESSCDPEDSDAQSVLVGPKEATS